MKGFNEKEVNKRNTLQTLVRRISDKIDKRLSGLTETRRMAVLGESPRRFALTTKTTTVIMCALSRRWISASGLEHRPIGVSLA